MKKTFYKNFGIIAVAIIFLFTAIKVSAWTDPSIAPPGGNATAPINVGSTAQIKQGNLWIEALNSLGQPYTIGLIVENGNVAIGTTSPLSSLHVNNQANPAVIQITDGRGSGSAGETGVKFGQSNGYRGELVYNAPGDYVELRSVNNNVANSGIALPYSSSNVGIGTTSPSEKLEVNGNVKATAFLYSSDLSLKKNIKPIENQLDKVLSLNPVSYSWKADEKPDVGFVAQDVEKIFPEVVHTNAETNLKSIDYAKLTVYLVQAIKEQQKEIEQLKIHPVK